MAGIPRRATLRMADIQSQHLTTKVNINKHRHGMCTEIIKHRRAMCAEVMNHRHAMCRYLSNTQRVQKLLNIDTQCAQKLSHIGKHCVQRRWHSLAPCGIWQWSIAQGSLGMGINIDACFKISTTTVCDSFLGMLIIVVSLLILLT